MKYLFLVILLFSVKISYTQCAFLNAGSDQNLSCTDTCRNLIANYSIFNETTSYNITSIPYNPLSYTSGILYTIPIDDRWSGIINLPFTFCFFGQQYNQFVLGTNGVISFNLSYSGLYCPWPFTNPIPTNWATPAPGFPRPMIGLYHDIDPSAASDPTEPCQPNCGEVRYGLSGTYPCRKFVISYNNIPHYNCILNRSKFQIILYELTNIIEIHVERKQTCGSWNGGRACLGIQNDLGTIGYAPPGRNTGNWTILNTPEAWRFSPSGSISSSFRWTDINGNFISSSPIINVCDQTTTQYIAVVENCGILIKDTIQLNLTNNISTGPIYTE
ncbi:MAG TPA: hypothetical protein PLC25_03525 [Bacilli bacterium]|nr:hypothetical protein [Bacilli bacterium]